MNHDLLARERGVLLLVEYMLKSTILNGAPEQWSMNLGCGRFSKAQRSCCADEREKPVPKMNHSRCA